jgi:hypothetical protein
MRTSSPSLWIKLTYVALGALAVVAVRAGVEASHAQSVGSPGGTGNVGSDREAAWNSPDMLRARASVTEHLQDNTALSEAEKAEMLQGLETMTPAQMKLFALTHAHASKSGTHAQAHMTAQQSLQHAQQMAAAQQWWYQNVHKAEMNQSLAADNQADQNLNNISEGETAAANVEQQTLEEQKEFAQSNQAAKLDDLNNPYPNGGYANPYWGGGVHFHLYGP